MKMSFNQLFICFIWYPFQGKKAKIVSSYSAVWLEHNFHASRVNEWYLRQEKTEYVFFKKYLACKTEKLLFENLAAHLKAS